MTANSAPSRTTVVTSASHTMSTRSSGHSSSSISTICRADPSQNSWPSVFSCHAMPCRSTSARKSAGVYRASADLAKCGLLERKFAGAAPRLVKLQRPPPEIRIFLPGFSARSTTATRRPRCPARPAHIRPAAPPPSTMQSYRSIGQAIGGRADLANRRRSITKLPASEMAERDAGANGPAPPGRPSCWNPAGRLR